ncbi:hypothetical protein OG216_37955 [Streptomycetaceae bacterium NBC_01309]
MSGDIEQIELADAVEAVRNGLLEAAARGNGSPLGFVVGPIQMEFTVEIRREQGGRGGVKAWVASGEAHRTDSQAAYHRVQFELTPHDTRTGGSYLVGSEEPADVSGFTRG